MDLATTSKQKLQEIISNSGGEKSNGRFKISGFNRSPWKKYFNFPRKTSSRSTTTESFVFPSNVPMTY